MSVNSKIPYTDATWNPIRYINGWMCTKVSTGCLRCYAETFNGRFGNKLPYSGPDPAIGFRFDEQVLDKPLHWRKPRRIFVQSMGDLFHEAVPVEFVTRVFDIMCSWRWPNKAAERDGDESLLVDPGHTYQVLTKRPERIRQWLDWVDQYWPGDSPFNVCGDIGAVVPKYIWLGTTCENQEMADKRIPELLKIPAAVRFVSVEPMLGPVDFIKWFADCECDNCDWKGFQDNDTPEGGMKKIYTDDPAWREGWDDPEWVCPKCNSPGCGMSYSPIFNPYGDDPRIDWLIIGCESGPKRRPCKLEWVKDLIEQCDAAKIPAFVKQLDLNGKVSKDPAEWPEWARRREYPRKEQS